MPIFVNEQNIHSNNCEKKDANDFNLLVNDKAIDHNSFGVFHLNIRSINSNFDLLLAYLNTLKFKFPVIVLTETWVCDESINTFQIDDYSSFNIKAKGRSGGICIFVHNSFSAQQFSVEHGNSFQSLNLKVKYLTLEKLLLLLFIDLLRILGYFLMMKLRMPMVTCLMVITSCCLLEILI